MYMCSVLAACETMGNATTICSDKTGTLTKNRMTVVRVYAAKTDFKDAREAKGLASGLIEKIALSVAINSEPKSLYTIDEKTKLPNQTGNKVHCVAVICAMLVDMGAAQTECAFLQFADAIASKTYVQHREQYPEASYVKACRTLMVEASVDCSALGMQVHPFSSSKKRMSTVVRRDGGYRLYIKGASEILLPLCSKQDVGSGIETLDATEAAALKTNVIEAYGSEALRVLLLAYRDFDREEDWEDEDGLATELTLLAIAGIQVWAKSRRGRLMKQCVLLQDPVRDEVPEAVRTCLNAGVSVRMVTGDNIVTARAIAINCGIISPGDDFLVMEGLSPVASTLTTFHIAY